MNINHQRKFFKLRVGFLEKKESKIYLGLGFDFSSPAGEQEKKEKIGETEPTHIYT
jgi:hypothetical protein